MPYTKAISPVSNSYLTKGREYEILKLGLIYGYNGQSFQIQDDQGCERWMYENDFSFMTLKVWQLK